MVDAFFLPARMVIYGRSEPWMTVLAVIAVIVGVIWWILARVKHSEDARKRRAAEQAGHDVGAFQGEGFEGHSAADVPGAAATVVPSAAVPSERDAAWSEVFEPTTPAERLAQIAGAYPEFAAYLAQHPNAYAELREWAANQRSA